MNLYIVEFDNVRIFVDCRPAALQLQAEVVSVHSDSEEAVFAPVRPVTVPADPVLNAVLFAPSDHRYLVVLIEDKLAFGIYATLVILPPVCSIDAAGNRSSCEDFCLHPYSAFDKTMFLYPPNCVSFLGKTAVPCTVMADLLIRAQKFFRIFGCVCLATLLWNSYLFCVHVNMARIASVASTSSILAVDDDLRRDTDIWPCFVSHYIDPISEDTG